MIVTVCETCQPNGVVEKTRYYGVGACQSCGADGQDLHGLALSEILAVLASAASEYEARTLRAVARELRQQAEGCARAGLAVACGELTTTADRLLHKGLQQ